jgi:hypothetical protein
MTPMELEARYVAAEIGVNIFEVANAAAFAPIRIYQEIQKVLGPVFAAQAAEIERLRGTKAPNALEQKKRMLGGYRGRRYVACVAIADLCDVIKALGSEDKSDLPLPGGDYKEPPSPQVINELQNTAANLLRMILIFNDGRISPQKLNRF